MQNNNMTVRGYVPQTTGQMQPIPQPKQSLWQLLDPAAVALLVAAVLGLAYALYATISFWWLAAVLPHLVLAWVCLMLNAAAMFMGLRELMLVSAVGYFITALLFINYAYLLIPHVLLCLFAWYKAK